MLKIKFMVLKFTHRTVSGRIFVEIPPSDKPTSCRGRRDKFSRNSTFSLGRARGHSEWRRISKRTAAMRSRWSLIRISVSRSINKSFSSVAAYLAFSRCLITMWNRWKCRPLFYRCFDLLASPNPLPIRLFRQWIFSWIIRGVFAEAVPAIAILLDTLMPTGDSRLK